MSSRGVPGAAQLSATAASLPQHRRLASGKQVRDAYHRRLEQCVTQATDAFQGIVEACEISDRTSDGCTRLQSQVEAGQLARAAEGILHLISELKIGAITQEFTDADQEVSETRRAYDLQTKQTLHYIRILAGDVNNSLAALERHYYASWTRWKEDSDSTLTQDEDGLHQQTQ